MGKITLRIVLVKQKSVEKRVCKEKLLRHLSNKTFLKTLMRKSKEKKCIIDIRNIVTMPPRAFKSTKRT